MSTHAQPFSIETLIDILVAETDRLETRKYAEVGVPMFLVGEDATDAGVATAANADAASSLGTDLLQLAGALAMRKPHLDLDDVAKLLEVLADRYFVPDEAEDRAGAERFLPASANLLLPTGAPPELADLADGLARGRGIRMVNFHATPRYREAEYRRDIAALAEHFEPITPANFESAVDGTWTHERPGLLPALFEGFRDNYDVLLPILEEHGFTAWLFVPSGFLTVPAGEQRAYAAAHDLFLPEDDEYAGDRVALTWDEARAIRARGHAFACHTRSHSVVTADTSRTVLTNEITAAKADMDRELGDGVDIFCWLEGLPLGVNAEADAMLRDAGFRYLFSNFKVQKLR